MPRSFVEWLLSTLCVCSLFLPLALPVTAQDQPQTAVAGAQVELEWDYNATGGPAGTPPATGFLVQRSTSPNGPFTTLAQGTLSDPSMRKFIDTTLTAGQTYTYRVLAVDAKGGKQSAPSNALTFSPTTLVPSAPTNLRGRLAP